MSDGLKRTIAAIIGVAGIAYIARLMAQGQTFVVDSLIAQQMIVGAVFIALFLAFVIRLSIRPLAIKRLKRRVVLYSIVVIFLGHYLLIDRADQGIFAGDIVSVIGVIIFFLAISGVLFTKKAKKELEAKIQEIIEV